jgi:dTDP-4-dehydrorhamnose 3,5-epimerase
MTFRETPLAGAYLVEPELRHDSRGFNARQWCQREFEAQKLASTVVQANMIFNHAKGTLRGLHYQVPPAAETKVFRCIRGSIFDVIVDLRDESPTFMQWFGVELTSASRRMLYVPQRFAQGFVTLEDDTELLYQVSAFHTPACERGIRYDDPAFAIRWPLAPSVISEKDTRWPDFRPAAATLGALK